MTTYTNLNQVIDITSPTTVPASKAIFYRTCAGKCATCSGSNTSYCLSCYTTSYGVITGATYGGYNTMTSDNQCVDVCGDGYYNTSGTCFTCVSPCKNCVSSTQCTSCLTGFYFVATNAANSRCPTTCAPGAFSNSVTNTCDSCSTTCATCSSTPNTCTTCSGSLYLSGTQCISICPDGKF